MANILKNVDLIDCWFAASPNDKVSKLHQFVKRKIGSLYSKKDKNISQNILFFNSDMKKFWKESKYNRKYFENKYSSWLSWTFFDPDNVS